MFQDLFVDSEIRWCQINERISWEIPREILASLSPSASYSREFLVFPRKILKICADRFTSENEL
jgi:hypothetical protein